MACSAALGGCLLDRTSLSDVDAGPVLDAALRDAAKPDDAGPRDAGPLTVDAATCEPGPESCNGVDDDCDGRTDEETPPSACATACGLGETQCEDGAPVCKAIAPAEETCNGLDDDCDMSIDEDLFQACSSACGAGRARCSGGIWLACESASASPETCDGLDQDCDGRIDEGVSRTCTGECGEGTERCEAGAFSACSAAPVDEICNAADDDCDGSVDEGDVCPCDALSGPSAAYLFCAMAMDWLSAQTFCQTHGYELATLADETTNTFVTERALERVNLDWWIGYNDRTSEGVWVWASGRTSTYQNFHSTQPNSSLGEQDCVSLDNGSQDWEGRGEWGDRDCASLFSFVCDAR
ncbi:MAG: C-type lectin domain-containing protein [Sandaracinaceae bacterium]